MKGVSLINDYDKNITKGQVYNIIGDHFEFYVVENKDGKQELIDKDCIILYDIENIKEHSILFGKLFDEMENYVDIDKMDMYEKARDNLLSFIGYMEFLK